MELYLQAFMVLCLGPGKILPRSIIA